VVVENFVITFIIIVLVNSRIVVMKMKLSVMSDPFCYLVVFIYTSGELVCTLSLHSSQFEVNIKLGVDFFFDNLSWL